MHTQSAKRILWVLGLMMSIALLACTAEVVSAEAPATATVTPTAIDESVVSDPSTVSTPSGPFTGALTQIDIDGILYMREEEKLAHDVYLVLYEQWGLPIFRNIANSEASHMEAVLTLIERYDLSDPVADNDTGVFDNPTLQGLYDSLVVQGSQSLSAALRVGALIEEIDIVDLEERIARTDRADIQRVYENLTRGSRNHLRAFVSTLDRQSGETYQPQYLSQSAFDAIVGTGTERGGRGRGRR